MKISMLYVVVFIFISTCLLDIHVLSGVVTVQWNFLFSVSRTGWPSCLFTSPCSRNTAQSIFQTLSHQEPGTTTLSAGSVILISCNTSTLSFILTYLTCVHSFICLFRRFLLPNCTRMPQVYLYQRITLPVGEAWIQCTTP